MSLWEGGGAVGGLWLPGGGVAPVCTFTAPINPTTPSSLDLWGAHLTPQNQYAAAVPAVPAISQSASGGIVLYGTANNGFGFGIQSGTFSGPLTFEARWVFDALNVTGVPMVCTAESLGGDGASFTLEWSDNGTVWTSLGAIPNGAPMAVANLRHRYWSLHYGPTTTVGGLFFYPGFDFSGILLWESF